MSEKPTAKTKWKLYVTLALLIFAVIGLSVMGVRALLDPGRFDLFSQVGLARTAVLASAHPVKAAARGVTGVHPRAEEAPMGFFEHTESWIKGESFEGGMLALFGAALVVLGLYFWKLGHSPTHRALIIPFLAVGLLVGLGGGIGVYVNSVRLERLRADHKKDPAAFVKQEKQRVDGFLGWYRPLLISWSVLILIGLSLFNFWGGNWGRAIGLGVILLAVAGLMVDHTSEHNARVYAAEINRALGP